MAEFVSRSEFSVMLKSHQKTQILGGHRRPIIQIHDIAFSIPAHHHHGLGHLVSGGAGPLIGIDPAAAFFFVDGLLVAFGSIGGGLARPNFGPGAA